MLLRLFNSFIRFNYDVIMNEVKKNEFDPMISFFLGMKKFRFSHLTFNFDMQRARALITFSV